ncbi:hypothetical protein JHK87_010021 [Glycine soja]|nr:hypothetical protein JHK87_010021 [Glycine soja]
MVPGSADTSRQHFTTDRFEIFSVKQEPASLTLMPLRGHDSGEALPLIVKSKPHFDASRFAKAPAFSKDIGGSSILFLPCSLYNWTPPEGAGQFHGMPLDVKE